MPRLAKSRNPDKVAESQEFHRLPFHPGRRKLSRAKQMSDQAAEDKRPSPEALLEEASRETRGHLKLFLGAAPGVGKTYEMLLSAAARRRDGADVVIGIVETHGREETQALVE